MFFNQESAFENVVNKISAISLRSHTKIKFKISTSELTQKEFQIYPQS